ncbi:MAG: hypothetical protein WCO52_01660 [bacterium]
MTTENNRGAQAPMTTEEVLGYIAQMGRDLTWYANVVLAMLAEAEARRIPVNLEQRLGLAEFAALGEQEIALIGMRDQVMSATAILAESGVLVTTTELAARLEKMGKPSFQELHPEGAQPPAEQQPSLKRSPLQLYTDRAPVAAPEGLLGRPPFGNYADGA